MMSNKFNMTRNLGTIPNINLQKREEKFRGTPNHEEYPPKFNIAPENRESQKETHVPTIHFQGLC